MAMPGILQQLAKSSPMMGRIKQMMGMMQGVQDPSSMLAGMARNNPQMQQVMNWVRDNGGDAKKAFYALAEQKGVDPQEILDMLK